MNKKTRKDCDLLAERLEKLQSELDDVCSSVQSLLDDEQGKFDNLPESFQNGDKGEAMQSAITQLEECVSECETARDGAENAAQALRGVE